MHKLTQPLTVADAYSSNPPCWTMELPVGTEIIDDSDPNRLTFLEPGTGKRLCGRVVESPSGTPKITTEVRGWRANYQVSWTADFAGSKIGGALREWMDDDCDVKRQDFIPRVRGYPFKRQAQAAARALVEDGEALGQILIEVHARRASRLRAERALKEARTRVYDAAFLAEAWGLL